MRLLLDTHIFLWFVSGDKKLALALRSIISDPQNEIVLSVVSLWEMIIKYNLGHLPLPQPPELYVPTQRRRLHIESLAVDEGSVFKSPNCPLCIVIRLTACSLDRRLSITSNLSL